MDKPELVVCAAVLVTYREDGELKEVVFEGVRHHSILQGIPFRYFVDNHDIVKKEEGFVTNKYDDKNKRYRYVCRRIALAITEGNGQPLNDIETCPHELFSEHLY